MKFVKNIFIVMLFLSIMASAQSRTAQKHSRGMLHQTVYNTGELGRAFDRGDAGMLDGFSSMEWPPNSKVTIERKEFKGQHNSFGGESYKIHRVSRRLDTG